MSTTGLYWFTHDLRLDDNPGLTRAARECDRLLCVYAFDPAWEQPGRWYSRHLGRARRQFLQQSLRDLRDSLRLYRQDLLVVSANPLQALLKLVQHCGIDRVYSSRHAGLYESRLLQEAARLLPHVRFCYAESHTLFERRDLPFTLDELPPDFTRFRQQVASLKIRRPLPVPAVLPPMMPHLTSLLPLYPGMHTSMAPGGNTIPADFHGGEIGAMAQLRRYFGSAAPSTYKATRNQLDGWSGSTKFSPWLSNGSLSPRRLVAALQDYEQRCGGNESTGWILFELLWREYFQWYGHAHGARLFWRGGPAARKPLTSFYPTRFRQWCEGATPYPLVNACMKQLNATGFMSNRGRQLAASCFVHELALDWRYGAAYFEQQLIDFDVASNWGNWQYLAGVGADPRGQRHFNLDKQTRQYDPDGSFIARWQGAAVTPLDTVDAADWPLGGAG